MTSVRPPSPWRFQCSVLTDEQPEKMSESVAAVTKKSLHVLKAQEVWVDGVDQLDCLDRQAAASAICSGSATGETKVLARRRGPKARPPCRARLGRRWR